MYASWEKGEVREVKLGYSRKLPGKRSYGVSYSTYEIPAAYHRIVCQLVAEDLHARFDSSHESVRRQAYAVEVLDAFGDELRELNRSNLLPADFRSKVLTPILQRQLNGIYDAYGPSVHAAIPKEGEELTIQDVTNFYLKEDPTDPIFIPTYRHNLLYLPDPRWHLGSVMGEGPFSEEVAISRYHKVRENHYAIMQDLEVEGQRMRENSRIPLLSRNEVRCIIDEGLEDFFADELQHVVRDTSLTHLHLLTS